MQSLLLCKREGEQGNVISAIVKIYTCSCVCSGKLQQEDVIPAKAGIHRLFSRGNLSLSKSIIILRRK
jgi:hypothetical protein